MEEILARSTSLQQRPNSFVQINPSLEFRSWRDPDPYISECRGEMRMASVGSQRARGTLIPSDQHGGFI